MLLRAGVLVPGRPGHEPGIEVPYKPVFGPEAVPAVPAFDLRDALAIEERICQAVHLPGIADQIPGGRVLKGNLHDQFQASRERVNVRGFCCVNFGQKSLRRGFELLRHDQCPRLDRQIFTLPAALAAQIADPALRKAQGVAALAQEAANQAYVMAYNDAYRLTAAVALAALVALTLHIWRDAMVARRLRRAPKAPIPESQA